MFSTYFKLKVQMLSFVLYLIVTAGLQRAALKTELLPRGAKGALLAITLSHFLSLIPPTCFIYCLLVMMEI